MTMTIRADAVEATLCEDGKTIMVEAFRGDNSLGMWQIDLGKTVPDIDHEKIAEGAMKLMRRAFGQKLHDQLSVWVRRTALRAPGGASAKP